MAQGQHAELCLSDEEVTMWLRAAGGHAYPQFPQLTEVLLTQKSY